MVDTMAAALARNGEYKEAELWQKRSLSLLAEDKDISAADRKKLEDEFNTRLKLYQKQTPYTEPVKKARKEPNRCRRTPSSKISAFPMRNRRKHRRNPVAARWCEL